MDNSENKLIHGTIYKLSDDEGNFYLGITTQTLIDRFNEHKSDAKKIKNNKLYEIFTYEKFCDNKIKIELIKEVEIKVLENEGK